MSKRSDAIELMKANADRSMSEVVKMIAEKISVTESNAKSYYRWIVANGRAPGEVGKVTVKVEGTVKVKKKAGAAPATVKKKVKVADAVLAANAVYRNLDDKTKAKVKGSLGMVKSAVEGQVWAYRSAADAAALASDLFASIAA